MAKQSWDGIMHTESFGAYLKSIRLRVGLSRATLSKKSGVSGSTIMRAERNQCPDNKSTLKILDALEISGEEREILYALLPKEYKDSMWDGKLHTESFGAYLKSLRLREGFSKTGLAKITNRQYPDNICLAESGRKTYSTCAVFADILCRTDEERKTFSELLEAELTRKRQEKCAQMSVGSDFGSYLRLLRLKKGLSGEKLGRMIGTTGQYILAVEGNRYGASKHLNQISDALELSESEKEELFKRHQLQYAPKKNTTYKQGDNLGSHIRALRESTGMCQKDLAKKAGIKAGTLLDIEKGRRTPHKSTLKRIADALELSDDEREKLYELK